MCIAIGVLEILRGTLCKVYDCLTTQLYTLNQYIIKNIYGETDTITFSN